jgi:hypothetical protein
MCGKTPTEIAAASSGALRSSSVTIELHYLHAVLFWLAVLFLYFFDVGS